MNCSEHRRPEQSQSYSHPDYDAVVIAPNLRGGPTGLEHGRLFMSAATPANLFRILSPATQVLLLGCWLGTLIAPMHLALARHPGPYA